MVSQFWFPHTKLCPPQVGNDVLPRPALLEALHTAVLSHRLTLLSAPAGSGKTTAVATLHRAYPDLLLGWLTLDENDSDPLAFLTLFVAALQSCVPNCGQAVAALLEDQTAVATPPRRIVSLLINDILAVDPEPLVLVLDDLHRVEETAVYDLLDYLLENLPPPLHLIILSRIDPPLLLARLRARGQLAEFRLPHLRLTLPEVATLLNDHFQLNLPGSDVQTVQNRVEGWAAGLRLLTVTLSRMDTVSERTNLLHRLAQTDRYLFDLLAEEVLNQQTTDMRSFLLETSILSELTPDLCAAVTRRNNTDHLLDEAYRHNLFLVAVWDRETTLSYRYHTLFADFLGHQLQREAPEKVTELHRRAAAAITLPALKITHYLAAAAWKEAADILEQIGQQLLQQGRAEMLASWIDSLPDEVRQSRPRLTYFLGEIAVDRSDFLRAKPLLTTAMEQLEAAGETDLFSAGLMELAHVFQNLQHFEQAEALLLQALEHPLPPHQQVSAHIGLAWAYIWHNAWDKVDWHTRQAMKIALESGDRGAMMRLAHALHTALAFGSMGLQPLADYNRQIFSRLGDDTGVIQTGALALSGFIAVYRADLAEAERLITRAQEMSQELAGFALTDINLTLARLTTFLAQADYIAHEQHWQANLPMFTQGNGWFMETSYSFRRGRALWLQGRLAELEELNQRLTLSPPMLNFPENRLIKTFLAGLVALGNGRLPEAETHLLEAKTALTHTRQILAHGHPQLWLARLYWQWQRPPAALAELEPVLAYCHQRGMPGLILQEGAAMIPLLRLALTHNLYPKMAQRLLDILDPDQEPRPFVVPHTNETLSPREVEVLQLLMTGASNQAIADKLVISRWTVKSHVTRILAKLAVSSRTEAAALARELGIHPA